MTVYNTPPGIVYNTPLGIVYNTPPRTVYNTRLGRNAEPVSSKTSAARITTMAALGGSRLDLSMDVSLGG